MVRTSSAKSQNSSKVSGRTRVTAPASSKSAISNAQVGKNSLLSSAKRPLIDNADFAAMRSDMAQYDATRDRIIKESRDITSASKHAIYSLHRGDTEAAKTQISQAEAVIAKLLPLIKAQPDLRHGSFSQSLEEYAEACMFYEFTKSGTLPTRRELAALTADEYLLGLCDLTGELMRYAVLRGTKKDVHSVRCARALVDGIFGELLLFDFRNGELRKKYDSVKYNLQKIEQVLYDLRDD